MLGLLRCCLGRSSFLFLPLPPPFAGVPPRADPENGEAGSASDQMVTQFFQVREKGSEALL